MVFQHLSAAFDLVLTWNMFIVLLSSALFGLFVGAVPGLSATMATAMLVPLTFFMDPVRLAASPLS